MVLSAQGKVQGFDAPVFSRVFVVEELSFQFSHRTGGFVDRMRAHLHKLMLSQALDLSNGGFCGLTLFWACGGSVRAFALQVPA